MKNIMFAGAALAVLAAQCAVVPVSPVADAEVKLVADAQKKVMNMAKYDERLAFLQWDRANGKKVRHDKHWRKALPVTLEWKATEGEKGPWKIEIGRKSDFSDARVWYKPVRETDKATGRTGGKDLSKKNEKFEVPLANFEINAKYYWRVSAHPLCGWGCHPKHGCEAAKKVVTSEAASFKTEDFAPRWMAIEGRVDNMRDLGGRKTVDGRRVKQGMIYRGQGLNDNSVTGETQGKNRLTANDVAYMTKTLGIKTDLDQRTQGEVADMKGSPLGAGVKWIHNSSHAYAGIFTRDGMDVMARNFRVFCDPANYPVYFHCIGGADRAGSLAYTLNGILGVDRHELETDWESTFYPTLPEMRNDYTGRKYWCGEWHFNDGFEKYGDADTPWNKKIELYLLDCGVTAAEIASFREIMLEK